MILPCHHEERVVCQVQPAIDLLSNLDALHPEVLLQHSLVPGDYRRGLVFRSAIESIRGRFIASSVTGREGLVDGVLENLVQHKLVADYERTGTSSRYDFTVGLRRNPDYFAAIEVKGGEGNSINISERPLWAKEFAVWCHLDGAIVNQPSSGAHSIVNRLTNELLRRRKVVDVLFFKDVLCGTPTRPCPKYPGREEQVGLEAAPDVFLLPRCTPTVDNPEPEVHLLDSLLLPSLVLQLFGVPEKKRAQHVWEVHVRLVEAAMGKLRRAVTVRHQGEDVDTSTSRAWRA